MAATVTTPYLESVQVINEDPEGDWPTLLRMKWRATLIATGAVAEVTTEYALSGPDNLGQAEWDDNWDGALAAYASIYANSPTVPPTNPIVI